MTGLKKNLDSLSYEEKRAMIEFWNKDLSVYAQTKILGISRSFLYQKNKVNQTNDLDDKLMEEIDKIYSNLPFYWARRIRKELEILGYNRVTRYKVKELMKIMRIEAIYPKRKTSIPNKDHIKYPYLLRGKKITKVNEVWSIDITFIKLDKGWIYMVAIIDWYSRKVISWRLSNTMDVEFCIECLKESLEIGTPEIFNSDQWSQFTSNAFTSILEEKGIKISMDGVWRCLDNIYIERFWRSLKHENIHIKKYENMMDAYKWIVEYIEFYNNKRIHQSLDYSYPGKVWLDWLLKQKQE